MINQILFELNYLNVDLWFAVACMQERHFGNMNKHLKNMYILSVDRFLKFSEFEVLKEPELFTPLNHPLILSMLSGFTLVGLNFPLQKNQVKDLDSQIIKKKITNYNINTS